MFPSKDNSHHPIRRGTAVTLPSAKELNARRLSMAAHKNKRGSMSDLHVSHIPQQQQVHVQHDTNQILLMHAAFHHINKQHAINTNNMLHKYFYKWKVEIEVEYDSLLKNSEKSTLLMLRSVKERYDDSYDDYHLDKRNSSTLALVCMRWQLFGNAKLNIRTAFTKWIIHNRREITYPDNDKTSTKYAEAIEQVKYLKEKLKEFKRNALTREKVFRDGIVKNQFSAFIKSTSKTSLRRKFDVWKMNTLKLRLGAEMRRQQAKVDIGFQQISSEREMVKEIEILSIKLQSQLLFTQAFYTWKLKYKSEMIQNERKKWGIERKTIMTEIEHIRRSIYAVNRNEEKMVSAAVGRGEEIFQKLSRSSNRLVDVNPAVLTSESIQNPALSTPGYTTITSPSPQSPAPGLTMLTPSSTQRRLSSSTSPYSGNKNSYYQIDTSLGNSRGEVK
jgi:hypothetical protein